MSPDAVLRFWFDDLKPQNWFEKNSQLDLQIKEKFLSTYRSTVHGENAHWRASITGRLAEILVLDQFSRNIFRNQPEAFRWDPLALALSQEAVSNQGLEALAPPQKAFLILPYMHSESKAIHRDAVPLFSKPGLERHLEFELRHKAIIDRFGRYPHRNHILGRTSTQAEIAFLKTPGSSF